METPLSGDSPLAALSDNLADIVERVGRSVVAVHGRHRIPSSGIIWRQGVVVTAAHSVKREEGLRVTLPDGRTVSGTLAGRDAGTDIAVLRLDGVDTGLEPVEFGDANSLKAGHFVLAIARADGRRTSADSGIVGMVDGPWQTWRGGRVDALICLDGGLHAGFSGAALADARGRVMGICTSALSRGTGIVIPGSTVDRIAVELLAKGRVSHGYLGLGTQQIALPDAWVEKLKLTSHRALVVVSLAPGGPAETAGVLIGDVLVGLGGQPVRDMGDVQAMLSSERIGHPLKAELIRGGEPRECSIIVGERPQRNRCW